MILRRLGGRSRRAIKLVVLLLITVAWLGRYVPSQRYKVPKGQKPDLVSMETTGYCKCGKCCGWERNWKFQPVVSYGPQKGRPKAVGITAAGTRARPGTIAADTNHYPFGTIMHIPGYGWGRVEDIGGAIKGKHIDLYFSSHKKALTWGRKMRDVKVWKPQHKK